ncbi:MAG: hypothetical protein H6R10_2294 [Rhodocyclaceae bacterium]|nr:hypothetical protein [Rhodocyclaceae bacterium]
MGILNWLRHGGRGESEQGKQLIGEAVERIVKLNPQLRLARRYQARLEPAVATSLKHVGDIVASAPAPREASAAAWSSDPYIHAFFAAPDDVPRALSRSTDLRSYFERNTDLPEVYALLGMAMDERKIAGLALQGETVRRDVVQTTVSFSDHRVRVCGRTEADLRQEIVRRLVDQLGLDGLARIAADKSRRDLLEQDRALLKTRLQLLERQGAGIRSMLGSNGSGTSEELAHLQEQIEENERALHGLGLRTEALERDFDQLCAVLEDPRPHIYVEDRRLRLDKMNVVQPESSEQAGEDFTFHIARVPTTPPQMRAFALVRCRRSELLPAANLLDEAVRQLTMMR